MSTLGYEEKLEKIKKKMMQRKRGKQKEKKRNLKKILNAKEEVLEQEVELLEWRTKALWHPIKTCGGKQGSFFRPADQGTKEQHKQFESENTQRT